MLGADALLPACVAALVLASRRGARYAAGIDGARQLVRRTTRLLPYDFRAAHAGRTAHGPGCSLASRRIHGGRGIYEAPHWDPARGGTARYVNVEWDADLALDDRPASDRGAPERGFRLPVNSVRASGQELPRPADEQVVRLWARHLGAVHRGGASDTRSAVAVGVDEAVTPSGSSDAVPLETVGSVAFDLVTSTTAQAVRREAQLVKRQQRGLEAKGHTIRRYRLHSRTGDTCLLTPPISPTTCCGKRKASRPGRPCVPLSDSSWTMAVHSTSTAVGRPTGGCSRRYQPPARRVLLLTRRPTRVPSTGRTFPWLTSIPSRSRPARSR